MAAAWNRAFLIGSPRKLLCRQVSNPPKPVFLFHVESEEVIDRRKLMSFRFVPSG